MTPRVLAVLGATLACATTAAAGQSARSTLSGDALAIACGPRASYEAPPSRPSVESSLTDAQGVFAPWHRLVINGGSDSGLKTGEQYFIRHVVPPRESRVAGEKVAYAIMTAGWIRIEEVQTHRAIGSVVHACGGIEPGDYLEPFAVPSVPTPRPPGSPDYSETGTVLFGVERSIVGGTGSMVVIDRGSNQGISAGQRLTIYRPSAAGPNVIIARGTAMLVSPDTSTIKLEDMRDAVLAGDRVAPHK